MPRTSHLDLQLNPNLQAAFAELHPTVETFLAAQEVLAVQEDTADLQFTQQAEEALLDYIRDHFVPAPINGLTLQDDLLQKSRILSTDCHSLDELLLKGVREGQVTEIAGSSATGKTQLCLQMAATTAWRGEHVIYIDTDKSFSAKRVVEIGASSNPTIEQGMDHISAHLARIAVHECHSLQSVLAALHEIDQKLQEHRSTAKTSLLVVDTLAAVIPATLNMTRTMQGHCLMLQTAILLKQMAERHKLAVIVTNYVVAGQNESVKAAMGETWRVQPHTRVFLSRQETDDEQPRRSATISASLLAPCGSRATFLINLKGVRDVTP